MGRLRGRNSLLGAAAAVAVAAGAAAPGLAGCGGHGGASGAGTPSISPRAAAQASARAFLDRYVAPDGRVVRSDQGGDTVSEGQAYALLAAVAARDRARFDRVWGWTRTHLRRDDGLLAWRWADGRVADQESATDADLDAAHALLLGAARFREPALKVHARRMADAMRGQEIRDGIVLAGPWAVPRGIANPSYFDPRALAALHMGDVARATRRLVAALIGDRGRLPPDWATVGPRPAPAGPPGGGGRPAYGFDAARVPIRLAASCDIRDRRLAASLRGLEQAVPAPHPVFTVARAAHAAAAGDRAEAARLLDAAAEQDRRAPTYYGAAWTALGRALLQSDLLGRCPARR